MNNTAAAIKILNALLSTAVQISALVAQAQAEGRTDFTPAEWAIIDANAKDADASLADAIAKSS